MKYLGIVAMIALASAPAATIAQNATDADDATPVIEPGGTAQGGLPVLTGAEIPFEAIIAGSFVLVGGVVIGVIAATDDNSPTVTTTTN